MQCQAKTKSGGRCKRHTSGMFCFAHTLEGRKKLKQSAAKGGKKVSERWRKMREAADRLPFGDDWEGAIESAYLQFAAAIDGEEENPHLKAFSLRWHQQWVKALEGRDKSKVPSGSGLTINFTAPSQLKSEEEIAAEREAA